MSSFLVWGEEGKGKQRHRRKGKSAQIFDGPQNPNWFALRTPVGHFRQTLPQRTRQLAYRKASWFSSPQICTAGIFQPDHRARDHPQGVLVIRKVQPRYPQLHAKVRNRRTVGSTHSELLTRPPALRRSKTLMRQRGQGALETCPVLYDLCTDG